MDDNVLTHYGILRRSGRYPWGSGGDPYQSNTDLVGYVNALEKEGFSLNEIADFLNSPFSDHLNLGVGEIKLRKSIAKNEQRAANSTMAMRLKDKGWGYSAIAKRMNMNESSVRSLLDPILIARAAIVQKVADILVSVIAKFKWVDIGLGADARLGVSRTKLKTAVLMLTDKDYRVTYHTAKQRGGDKTSYMILSKLGPRPPGMTEEDHLKAHWKEVNNNLEHVHVLNDAHSSDGGINFKARTPVKNIDSSRIFINYESTKDGIIELRRGVEDLNLGKSKYAQVRIAVDNELYLKGMAIYSDNIPSGYDIVFNTNKKPSVPKNKVLKKMLTAKDGSIDQNNPFGALIKDESEGGQRGALNILNEEGDWENWKKTLSSQFVSKQSNEFAKKQLSKYYDLRKNEYDEIQRLTNPALRQTLLKPFSDSADASSVHLEAAKLPRTRWAVLIPVPDMKKNEIYAPNHNDGEEVVLVRYPHGGIFEIPELVVNNRNPTAKKSLLQAKDAIGIHPSVAERLSGADFDGDAVLIIPTKGQKIVTGPALKDLKEFDHRTLYKKFEGMKVMGDVQEGLEMGNVSNLITDMTIQGAPPEDIVRAVKHSMVVIDAVNHELNWKQSERDNGIPALKLKYQGRTNAGAATLISKSESPDYVPHRKKGALEIIGPATDKTKKPYIDPVTGEKFQTKRVYIDTETGKKLYQPTGESYYPLNKKGPYVEDPGTGKKIYLERKLKPVEKKTKSTKMAEKDDAYELSSGTEMENIYAEHSNKLKSLANQARLDMINTVPRAWSKSARIAYKDEVNSLVNKYNLVLQNKPLERKALLLSTAEVKAKKAAYNLSPEQIKKLQATSLQKARDSLGAKKPTIDITPKEWEAIQAGAISHSALMKILINADLDKVKQFATPKKELSNVSTARIARARTLLNAGHTQAEVAAALGMSLSTVQEILNS